MRVDQRRSRRGGRRSSWSALRLAFSFRRELLLLGEQRLQRFAVAAALGVTDLATERAELRVARSAAELREPVLQHLRRRRVGLLLAEPGAGDTIGRLARQRANEIGRRRRRVGGADALEEPA